MKRFGHAALLAVLALAAGWSVNQFHPEGIPGRMTRAAFMSRSVIRRISADSARVVFQRGIAAFVDVRSAGEFRTGHIPGAENRPIQSFFRGFGGFERSHPKDSVYVFYCFEPYCREGRSMLAWMRERGYRRAAWMYGGLSEWMQNRWPVETGEPGP
jgi:rhodanese-related sulfurtransferase